MTQANLQEQVREKRLVAASSVVAAVFLTGIKLVVGLMTGSLGILAEAAHSGLDLVAAVITLFAVRVSDRPADETHLYGHGKVENLSALAETLLLLVTCVWISYEAHPAPVLRGSGDRSQPLGVPDHGGFNRHRFFEIPRAGARGDANTTARPWRPTPCISAPTSGARPW